MAVGYSVTISTIDFGFDFENQVIEIPNTVDQLAVIDLYTAIKDAQASEVGIVFPVIGTGEGLATLGVGIQTYLTLSLKDGWKISSLKTGGIFEVIGGNITKPDASQPFVNNPLVTYFAYYSQAGLVVSKVLDSDEKLGLAREIWVYNRDTDPGAP